MAREKRAEVASKSIVNHYPQKDLQYNKIPKFKHQITNKSQITIFNDQNSNYCCIESLRKPLQPVDSDIGHNLD